MRRIWQGSSSSGLFWVRPFVQKLRLAAFSSVTKLSSSRIGRYQRCLPLGFYMESHSPPITRSAPLKRVQVPWSQETFVAVGLSWSSDREGRVDSWDGRLLSGAHTGKLEPVGKSKNQRALQPAAGSLNFPKNKSLTKKNPKSRRRTTIPVFPLLLFF